MIPREESSFRLNTEKWQYEFPNSEKNNLVVHVRIIYGASLWKETTTTVFRFHPAILVFPRLNNRISVEGWLTRTCLNKQKAMFPKWKSGTYSQTILISRRIKNQLSYMYAGLLTVMVPCWQQHDWRGTKDKYRVAYLLTMNNYYIDFWLVFSIDDSLSVKFSAPMALFFLTQDTMEKSRYLDGIFFPCHRPCGMMYDLHEPWLWSKAMGKDSVLSRVEAARSWYGASSIGRW